MLTWDRCITSTLALTGEKPLKRRPHHRNRRRLLESKISTFLGKELLGSCGFAAARGQCVSTYPFAGGSKGKPRGTPPMFGCPYLNTPICITTTPLFSYAPIRDTAKPGSSSNDRIAKLAQGLNTALICRDCAAGLHVPALVIPHRFLPQVKQWKPPGQGRLSMGSLVLAVSDLE